MIFGSHPYPSVRMTLVRASERDCISLTLIMGWECSEDLRSGRYAGRIVLALGGYASQDCSLNITNSNPCANICPNRCPSVSSAGLSLSHHIARKYPQRRIRIQPHFRLVTQDRRLPFPERLASRIDQYRQSQSYHSQCDQPRR